MRRQGWNGPPLVYWSDLITWTHRQAALRRIYEEWESSDVEDLPVKGVPVISLEDVFHEAGMDVDETMKEMWELWWEFGGFPDLLEVLNLLPDEVRERYGIDLH